MRPIACRQFNVFDRVCAEGEDAFHTRRGDVLTPLRRYADEAYDLMLPFYGIKDRKERRAAVKSGRIHALARVLQGLDWTKLAQRMGQGGWAEHGIRRGPETGAWSPRKKPRRRGRCFD